MCGRYTDTKRDKEFLTRLGVTAAEFDFTPRYNIAPTQEAWIVARGQDGGLELRRARWGLIPFWAPDEKIGNSLINARSETVADKPAFRHSFRKRRCLVLADGFYEWRKTPGGKEPFYIHLRGRRPFAFGGLWEQWKSGERELESFCIITVPANERISTIHNRMPLILREQDFATWLDPNSSPDQVKALLRPYSTEEMEFYPVSKLVNNPRNENEGCIAPLAENRD